MASRFNDIERTAEFKRDLKKLLKRYRTLEEDIDTLINASLYAFHKLAIDTGGIVRLQRLGFEEPAVYKVKKFACRSLKGKGSQSGMRLIYSYLSESDTVVLIELYYKGDKSNEDRSRIKRLL
jgi:mRNA-degrading endonuclease RelE of RelBE toxin-antitoxin system